MPDEHEETIRELLLLQRVAQRISSVLDLDRLLEEILADVCGTFQYTRSTLWLKDDAANERRHLDSGSATVESLLDDVRGFVSGAPAADDQTAVLIRATG